MEGRRPRRPWNFCRSGSEKRLARPLALQVHFRIEWRDAGLGVRAFYEDCASTNLFEQEVNPKRLVGLSGFENLTGVHIMAEQLA